MVIAKLLPATAAPHFGYNLSGNIKLWFAKHLAFRALPQCRILLHATEALKLCEGFIVRPCANFIWTSLGSTSANTVSNVGATDCTNAPVLDEAPDVLFDASSALAMACVPTNAEYDALVFAQILPANLAEERCRTS